MKTQIHKGLHIRPDSYDKNIVGEIPRHYGTLDLKGKVVFDVGACFGAFTHHAIQAGAKRVYAYEPLPTNAKLLRKNAEYCEWGDKVVIQEVALINRMVEATDLSLWIPRNSTNHGMPSTVKRAGRFNVKVKAIDFPNQLNKHKPDVVKMDCEGAEYELLGAPLCLPLCVKQVAMEIHFGRQAFLASARDLVGRMMLNGWTETMHPEIRPGLWHTRGAWVR